MLKIMTQQTPSENRSLLPKTTGFEAPQFHTFNNNPLLQMKDFKVTGA